MQQNLKRRIFIYYIQYYSVNVLDVFV